MEPSSLALPVLLKNSYFSQIVADISNLDSKEARILRMQQLLSIINTDLEASLSIIAHRFAPDFELSFFPGRYFIVNSALLFKSLPSEPSLVNILAEGIEAFDL
jgi:hypothetical protein